MNKRGNWNPQSTQRARNLRKNLGETEKWVWSFLRRKQLGVQFRRQFPIGPFTLDFYSPEIRLCIEIDGEQHIPAENARRDAFLIKLEIDTLRIPSKDFWDGQQREQILQLVWNEVEKRKRA